MGRRTVQQKELAQIIRRQVMENPAAVKRGIANSTGPAQNSLKDKAPVGVRHELEGGWAHDDASVSNNAPHAGIVERGARPHRVNKEGWDQLLEYVEHKLGVTDDHERHLIVGAIVKRLEIEGQKPTYFIKDSLDSLSAEMLANIVTQLGMTLG